MCDFSFLKSISYEILDAPLSSTELSEFEQINNVSIPNDYRTFLEKIGNGIHVKLPSGDSRYIRGIKRPVAKRSNRRLKMDFIFNEPYHEWQNTHNFELPESCIHPEFEDDNSCELCIHLDDCFFAYSDNLSEYDHVIYNGAYPICGAGCTYVYFLIFTGTHRGEVWINNERYDFAPSKNSFYDFLKWAAVTDAI